MSEKFYFDELVEESEKRGEKRGKKLGEIRTRHMILLRLGKKKLGEPTRQTTSTIKKIRDNNRLDRMADAVLDVKSWPELLATP